MSVARFYREAGQVIDSALAKEGSVKNLCLSSRCRRKKQLYALVCQTLTHRQQIEALLTEADWAAKEPDLTTGLSWVLVHDLLFGPGVQCGGELKEKLMSRKPCLEEAFDSIKGTVEAAASQPRSVLPRHARINTLLVSRKDLLEQLAEEGYSIVEKQADQCVATVSSGQATPAVPVGAIRPNQCVMDAHLENVIAFAPGTDLHAHPLYTGGCLILQQKSSCMSAAELCPPHGATVVDACAAPGNKTTHLASLMNNSGHIYAFDLSPNRLTTLKETCQRAGATCVSARLHDFLKTDVTSKELCKVSHILVDPSCSGSGMVDRLDHLTNNRKEDKAGLAARLSRLAAFQQQAVLHALSFPSASDVVYSTCSIHAEENEDVVTAVLEKCRDWQLVKALPAWHRRGLDSYDCGDCCVRVLPEDGTSGFFLAHFQRSSTAAGHQVSKASKRSAGHLPSDKSTRAAGKRRHRDGHEGAASKRSRSPKSLSPPEDVGHDSGCPPLSSSTGGRPVAPKEDKSTGKKKRIQPMKRVRRPVTSAPPRIHK